MVISMKGQHHKCDVEYDLHVKWKCRRKLYQMKMKIENDPYGRAKL